MGVIEGDTRSLDCSSYRVSGGDLFKGYTTRLVQGS